MVMKKLAIKDMPKIERPREKLLRYGARKLATEELISIMLRHGTSKVSLSQISLEFSSMLKNTLRNSESLEFDQVKAIRGIGTVQSIEMLAMIELFQRFSVIKSNEPITSSYVYQDLFEAKTSKKEKFYAYFLDSRSSLIKRELISIGTVDTSLVHPREVFEPAIKLSAVSVIVAHNHPSGNFNPSDADIEITDVLKDCGELLGVKLLDHIIVSKEGFFSFRENNLVF